MHFCISYVFQRHRLNFIKMQGSMVPSRDPNLLEFRGLWHCLPYMICIGNSFFSVCWGIFCRHSMMELLRSFDMFVLMPWGNLEKHWKKLKTVPMVRPLGMLPDWAGELCSHGAPCTANLDFILRTKRTHATFSAIRGRYGSVMNTCLMTSHCI